MFCNNMNLSLLIGFYINRETLWLLVSQVARVSCPSYLVHPVLAKASYLHPGPVHFWGWLQAPLLALPLTQFAIFPLGPQQALS